MSRKYQTFEQPLNERIRMCLRVETLMRRFHYFEALKGDWSAYSALLTILELTALLERGDLKQELMKELERQHGALKALTQHQGIDHSKLELILSKQKSALERLHRLDGKLGEHLKRDDFLLAIKQRTSIPGGSCDFDLPARMGGALLSAGRRNRADPEDHSRQRIRETDSRRKWLLPETAGYQAGDPVDPYRYRRRGEDLSGNQCRKTSLLGQVHAARFGRDGAWPG
jgi:hypothetical protein